MTWLLCAFLLNHPRLMPADKTLFYAEALALPPRASMHGGQDTVAAHIQSAANAQRRKSKPLVLKAQVRVRPAYANLAVRRRTAARLFDPDPMVFSYRGDAHFPEADYFSLKELEQREPALLARAQPWVALFSYQLIESLTAIPSDVLRVLSTVRMPPYITRGENQDKHPLIFFSSKFRVPRLDLYEFIENLLPLIGRLAEHGSKLDSGKIMAAESEFVLHDVGHVADYNGGVLIDPAQQTHVQEARAAFNKGYRLTKEEAKFIKAAEDDHRAEVFRETLPAGQRDPGAMGEVVVDGALNDLSRVPTPGELILLARDLVIWERIGDAGKAEAALQEAIRKIQASAPGFEKLLSAAVDYFRLYRKAHYYDPSWTQNPITPAMRRRNPQATAG